MWHTDLLTGAHTDECAGSSQALPSEEHKLSLLELSSHNLCAITYLRELEYIQFWHCIISRIRNLDIASWPPVFLPALRRLRTMDLTRPFKMLSVGDRWGPMICKLFLHVYLVWSSLSPVEKWLYSYFANQVADLEKLICPTLEAASDEQLPFFSAVFYGDGSTSTIQ